MTKHNQKVTSIILALALGVAAAGCGSTSTEQAGEKQATTSQESYKELTVGNTAPDFTAELADGGSFTLSEQTDKIVLLNFWATWCGPCVGEMPAFEKLAEEYKEEVAVLAVNCMEDEGTVNQFIKENGYTFPIAYDEKGTINEKYPTDGIPYTLIISKDGVVKRIFVGAKDADAQYEEYKNAIEEVLSE